MADAAAVCWDDSGPRGPARWVPVVKIDAGQSERVVCVSSAACGVWLHWLEGRTVPCRGEEGGCPYHHGEGEGGLRWKAYFAVVRGRGQGVEYAAVTAEGWKMCPGFAEASRRRALRGVEVTLSRLRGDRRRPLRVALPEPDRVVSWVRSLPPEPDVRAAIQTLLRGKPAGADCPAKGE